MNALRRRTILHAGMWTAAGIVGVTAVLYARLISWLQAIYFHHFAAHPYVVAVLGPLFFVVAAGLVQFVAPEASGSGIPQVLEAIESAESEPEHIWKSGLVSLRTAMIKVVSCAVGIVGGASIGREGPTVQIAASLFTAIGRYTRRWLPQLEFRWFAVAGGAAGIAAAFNTPLAGITFAIEEIGEGELGHFTESAMLASILAGVAALGLAGEYLYFGHPAINITNPLPALLPDTLATALLGGVLGGVFARLLAYPALARLPKHGWRRALICGIICSAIGVATKGQTAGSGYEVAKYFLESKVFDLQQWHMWFGVEKIITTVLSYLSGMAGGIFSPCLSIGAGIGFSYAAIVGSANYKACALLGMVGFFSAAVQAPLTSVVIVMEMTGEHILILPFLLTAFIARAVGRIFMPVPLYRYLAESHLREEGHAATPEPQDKLRPGSSAG